MSATPEDLRYSAEHEWVRVADGLATIGISHFAPEHLGDVVYVELPEPGVTLKQHGSLGVVESVKTASDIYAPVSGEVVERNPRVIEKPELVNQDPYGEGWLIKVRLSDPAEPGTLLDAAAYRAHVGG